MAQPPIDKFCRLCGGQLEITTKRERVGGLFGNRQWNVQTKCRQCGHEDGAGVAYLTRQKTGAIAAVRRWLASLPWPLGGAPRGVKRHQRRVQRPTGLGHRPQLSRIFQEAGFPIYGLDLGANGWRAHSVGHGGGGLTPETRRFHVHLGYVRGSNEAGRQVFDLSQSSAGRLDTQVDAETALWAIESLQKNYASRERKDRWSTGGNFHQEWNERRVETATRITFEVPVGGADVLVGALQFSEEAIMVGTLAIDGRPAQFSTLGLNEEELKETLASLVVISDKTESVARHQEQMDAAFEELRT